MTGPLQDELLSAYLDGELSAQERRYVEQRLAESPQDRQLVEELRQLSESLQSMPRHELGAGFREKVLRQAERAMLTRPADRPAVLTPDRQSRRWLPVRGYRPLVWPALVAAAALMLMIVYPDEDARRPEVAKVSKAPAEAADVADREDVAQTDGITTIRSRDVESERMTVRVDADPATVANGPESSLALKAGGESIAKTRFHDDGWLQGLASPDGGALIVRIDVSREAAKARAFDELLARQKITWDQADREEEAADRPLGRLEFRRSERPRRPASGAPMSVDRLTGPAGEDVKAVRVVVTPCQMHGALADLWARTDLFPAVEVHPDPNEPRQEQFFSYGRSRKRGTRPAGGPESSGRDRSEPDVGGTKGDEGRHVQTRRLGAEELDADDLAPDRREKEGLSRRQPRSAGVAGEAEDRGTRRSFGALPAEQSAERPKGGGLTRGPRAKRVPAPAVQKAELDTASQLEAGVPAATDKKPLRVLFLLRVVAPE